MTDVILAGENIQLLPQKAFFWAKESILGLSDVHLGKAASLQKQGVPIPAVFHDDLVRIGKLIESYKPREVYIIGDWIHHFTGFTAQLDYELQEFFAHFSNVNFRLVLGNHERGAGQFLKQYPMQIIIDHAKVGPFLFSHGHDLPMTEEGLFTIQGHVHPVVTLKQGSTKLRLPCFVIAGNSMTIPSFGELTGGYEIDPQDADRIFAVAGTEVFEVPPKSKRRPAET